jgi:hypothetical protein
MWSHGSYSVNSCVFQTTAGTGASYTISWEANDGLSTASAGSTVSTDSGSACGEAVYAVTYTWYGGGTPGNLTVTAEGDMTGSTTTTGGGTSSGWAYVETDSTGGLSNTQYTAPNFNYAALGIKTTFTSPSSPKTLLITGGAQATYSGNANTETSSKVYFK